MPIETKAGDAGVLESWTALVRRRWRVGVALLIGIFTLAAVLVLTSRPIYRVDARLRLGEPPPISGVSANTGIFGLFQLGGDPFANDLELLLSRTLSEAVVRDAALNATLHTSRGWHRDSIFAAFSATPSTAEATFELAWENGAVQLRMASPTDSLLGTFAPGTALAFGGVEATPYAWRRGMPRKVRIRTVPFGEAVRVFQNQLRIERARREANVVHISFNSGDPGVAESVVASAIARFIELRTTIQRRESGQTVDSLRVVANETLAELNRAEVEMEALQRRIQLVAPDAQTQAFVERYSEALVQLEAARSELSAVTALLRRVDATSEPARGWADLAAFPAFLQNETVGELLSGLNRLTEQRMELASRRTETSREHRVLSEQIERRDATIRAIAQGYRTALQERIGLLETQVAGMQAYLAGIPQQIIDFGHHQRSVRVLSEVLVLTEQRLRQEELRQALTFANVQVIDPPALQHRPVWPRKKLGLGVGFLIASLSGLLGLVVTERADRTIRRARDVRDLIGAPVLAVTVQDGGGAISLTPREVQAIVGGDARANRNGSTRAVVPVGAASRAEAVAAALRAGHGASPNGPGAAPVIQVTAMDGKLSAAAAVDGPVILAVGCGHTGRDELRRTAAFFRETGGEILGVVLVCRGAAEAAAVWE